MCFSLFSLNLHKGLVMKENIHNSYIQLKQQLLSLRYFFSVSWIIQIKKECVKSHHIINFIFTNDKQWIVIETLMDNLV